MKERLAERSDPSLGASGGSVDPSRSEATVSIRLRETGEADLAFVTAAERHPENRPFIVPWTEAEHEEALADPHFGHFVCEASVVAGPVGFVLLAGLLSPHRSVELRRLVVTVKGLGYGRAALREAEAVAFGTLGAHRLWLDVVESNSRARQLYASEGFREEGVLRDALWNGAGFESLVLMSLLEHERRRDA